MQRMPLPNFGPHVFDELKKNPSVLATKGVIPEYATQAERMKEITHSYLKSSIRKVNSRELKYFLSECQLREFLRVNEFYSSTE